MKRILIAAMTGLVLLVSVAEAQTSPATDVPQKSQQVEPPPPPPLPPVPPAPPVPPVPAIENGGEVAKGFVPPRVIQTEITRADVNEKGYVLIVKRVNRKAVVSVISDGSIIKQIDLKEWNANNKKYEELYGELPPPPPPPPAPPAPKAPRHGS